MAKTIAVTGKGGVGKTTVAAMAVRYLKEHAKGPILALDADPDSNLATVLGIEIGQTIGELREDLQRDIKDFPPGMSKEAYVEAGLHQLIVETPKLDLITMGRGEGPGCYCYINNLLRKFADDLLPTYEWLVMDNEAGMEHLSRRTTRDVDLLLVVSDPSVRGVTAAKRMRDLVDELETKVRRVVFVLNMAPENVPPELEQAAADTGMEIIGMLPRDPRVSEFDAVGKPLAQLPSDSPVRRAVADIAARVADVLEIKAAV